MTISNVQTAVQVAKQYFFSIQPEIGEDISDLRLEEVEKTEDRQYWLITLGYDRPHQTPYNSLNSLLKSSETLSETLNKKTKKREYKVVKIDADTGEVESIKIREI
ncbi:hypothetical protein PN462_11820 [Spirulina sp. CS-785/01]|uniref:hypothetical protein n=1 Tax=Spirulina sp. CS-785/01 TaxID=3021716 RepID=UPI00232DF750|nr:hypothetical protein [Spirulina sp. CS-785/01]MDB9313790.1 hypothetical protein [Spirulina sp. CS-785/01]